MKNLKLLLILKLMILSTVANSCNTQKYLARTSAIGAMV